MKTFIRDLKESARLLIRKPAFTATAVLILALGIGANTAVFSVLNGVLLRPLPYGDEQRIVTLWQTDVKRGVEREETSPANFLDWQAQSESFELMAMAEPFGHTWTDREPEAIRSWLVSPLFFETLGTTALHGRTFLPEEFQQGNTASVVLGYDLWQRRFGGDPNIVGQKLRLNGQPHSVVGILPPEFQYPSGRDLWAPRAGTPRDSQIRGAAYIRVIGRLKPGRTVAQAKEEMQSIAARLGAQYPVTNRDIGVAVVPLRDQLVGPVRPALLVLFGAVGLVLLMACANVANLLLVRTSARQRDFVIRTALGASRGRIVRQLLTESLVLASLGGAAAVLLSTWLIDVIVTLGAGNLPRIQQISLNSNVLLFALVLSLFAAILFGLSPALQAAGCNLQRGLSERAPSTVGGRRPYTLGNGLVIVQVALAFIVLVGAGLLVRSFVTLLRLDPGFTAEKALTLEVQLARRTPEQRVTFLDQTLEKIRALPGVRAAGAASAVPFHDNQVVVPTTINIEGRPSGREGDVTVNLITITPDYFRALGVPLLGGRFLTRLDTALAPVAVINETMAVRHWPADNPIGQKISYQTFGSRVTAEIVGVVGSVRTSGVEVEPKAELFVSHASLISGSATMTYFVRTAADPQSLLATVKQAIREVSNTQTFSSIAPIEELFDRSIARRRFLLFLLSAFAVLSLVLAGVGVYGLMSLSTTQRTKEIGIRLTLGAARGSVLQLLVGQGMILALIGIALGLAGALALTRVMKSLLYGISETDPLTFVSIAFVLAAVAFFACYIPACRALKRDPMVTLRYD